MPSVPAVNELPGRALAVVRQPDTQTELIQVAKSVLAAVVAWVLAVDVFGLAQAFLAPWTALLTVHATVYRTFWRGAQAVLATALGIAISFAIAELIGLGALTLGLALLLALTLARVGVLRAESVTVATTALFVLTAGYQQQQAMIGDRLLDVLIGVSVGVLTNLVIFPPLNDRSAQRQIDRVNEQLGDLFSTMANEMRSAWTEEHSQAWIERTRQMDADLVHAWQLVRHARESSWWNPRRRIMQNAADLATYSDVLNRLEDGIAQARSMARTIDEATRSAYEWDPRFREPWIDLLDEAGQCIADPDADVGHLHHKADDLTRELSAHDLPGLLWPLYGALISNLINVIDIVDDVATARPVRT